MVERPDLSQDLWDLDELLQIRSTPKAARQFWADAYEYFARARRASCPAWFWNEHLDDLPLLMQQETDEELGEPELEIHTYSYKWAILALAYGWKPRALIPCRALISAITAWVAEAVADVSAAVPTRPALTVPTAAELQACTNDRDPVTFEAWDEMPSPGEIVRVPITVRGGVTLYHCFNARELYQLRSHAGPFANVNPFTREPWTQEQLAVILAKEEELGLGF